MDERRKRLLRTIERYTSVTEGTQVTRKKGRIIYIAVLIAAIAASFAAGYFSRFLVAGGAQEVTTIKIGALLPLSGDLASFGARNRNAIQLAIEDVNRFAEKMGSRFRFQVLFEDTGTDPEAARSRMEALAAQGVKAFIGPMSSREVSQVKPFADANKLLVVSQSSTAVALAIPGDYVYRVVPPDSYQGKALAKFIYTGGFKNAIVIYRNDAWGKGLFENFKSNFEALGGKIESLAYDVSAKEFSAEVARTAELAQRLGPSTAVLLISFEEGIQIIKLAAGNPILSKLKWFGTDGLALNSKLASEAGAEAVLLGGLPSTIYVPSANPIQESFKARYRQLYGEDPDSYSLNSCDAVWLIALSIMLSGDYDGEKLAELLPLVANRYYGVTGTISLDENGDRKAGDYGIFQLLREGNEYAWRLVAVYSIDTDAVTPAGG
ncbi:MAG: ABC transporter substrate-binding protein [Thermofilaceae archaeon]